MRRNFENVMNITFADKKLQKIEITGVEIIEIVNYHKEK